MLHSKFLSILLAIFIISSCHKKDSDNLKNDLVRSSLSTSVATYDTAAPDSWVKVTAEEYNKMLTQVTQAVSCGATESFMNTTAVNSWNANVTAGGNDLVAKLPASSYIIGWSIRTGDFFPSNSANSKLKVSISQKTGYTTYGKPLPDIGSIPGNTRVYFVIKHPSTTTPASPCYTAVHNFTAFFVGLGNGGSEYYTAGESNSIVLSVSYSSLSQVISTIRKPY